MKLEDCGLTNEDLLIDEKAIAKRLTEIAAELDTKYAGEELLVIGVLTGAFIILADLCRRMTTPVEIDWIGLSSYGHSTTSSGTVRQTTDIRADVTGRHVLLVDDILDTGLTLHWLTGLVERAGAASVESCVLMRKPETAARNIEARYVGFDIPDVFAVGFGLDHAGKYRSLRCVAKAARGLHHELV